MAGKAGQYRRRRHGCVVAWGGGPRCEESARHAGSQGIQPEQQKGQGRSARFCDEGFGTDDLAGLMGRPESAPMNSVLRMRRWGRPLLHRTREMRAAEQAAEKAGAALTKQREALRELRASLRSPGVDTRNLGTESVRLGSQLDTFEAPDGGPVPGCGRQTRITGTSAANIWETSCPLLRWA